MTRVRVRRFSMCGPCSTVGTLERETSVFYTFRDPRGKVGRVGKKLTHIEPCRRCPDHPRTQYPKGHED